MNASSNLPNGWIVGPNNLVKESEIATTDGMQLIRPTELTVHETELQDYLPFTVCRDLVEFTQHEAYYTKLMRFVNDQRPDLWYETTIYDLNANSNKRTIIFMFLDENDASIMQIL